MAQITECHVFRPTMQEFSDFSKYVDGLAVQYPNMAICKVIPPPEWNHKSPYDSDRIPDLVIPNPITQYVSGNKGIYQLMLIEGDPLHLQEYKELAASEKIPRSSRYEDNDVDRIFWKNVRFNAPVYGADMSGSLFADEVVHWNTAKLDSILKVLCCDLPGITSPYLYFGMWKAMFAWHVEDMNLFSINYLHFGEPKAWYGIPPSHGKAFERLMAGYFPDLHKTCPEFLRHKTSLVSPSVLVGSNIPIQTALQEPNQFIITFPYAYHSGFNHGFNCAEAVNFATDHWVQHGVRAGSCKCNSDSVSINMQYFQHRYELWRSGSPEIAAQIEEYERLRASRPAVDPRTLAPAPRRMMGMAANRTHRDGAGRGKHPKTSDSDEDYSGEEVDDEEGETGWTYEIRRLTMEAMDEGESKSAVHDWSQVPIPTLKKWRIKWNKGTLLPDQDGIKRPKSSPKKRKLEEPAYNPSSKHKTPPAKRAAVPNGFVSSAPYSSVPASVSSRIKSEDRGFYASSSVSQHHSAQQRTTKQPRVAVASRGIPGACDKHRIAHERCPPECPRRAPLAKTARPAALSVNTMVATAAANRFPGASLLSASYMTSQTVAEPTLDDFLMSPPMPRREPGEPEDVGKPGSPHKRLAAEHLELLRRLYDEHGGLPPKKIREQLVHQLQWNIGQVYRWFWKEAQIRQSSGGGGGGGSETRRVGGLSSSFGSPQAPSSPQLMDPSLCSSPRSLFLSGSLDGPFKSDGLPPSAFAGLFSPPSSFSPKAEPPMSPRSMWEVPDEPPSPGSVPKLPSPSKVLPIDAQLLLPDLPLPGPSVPLESKLFSSPTLSPPWSGSLSAPPQFASVKAPPASVFVSGAR